MPYRTPRRADRPTTGAADRVIARLLGYDLNAAQQYTLDVAGELVEDPDTGGLVHAYDDIGLALPRRAGKSLLALVRQLRSAYRQPHARAWYTAQSRADAAQALVEDWIPAVEDAHPAIALSSSFRRSNGSESIRISPGGGQIAVFAPRPKSLHGRAGDIIMFDEAWAFDAERGQELEIAARPTMATRPGAQIWRMSAAGDIDSTWWNDTIDTGREAVEADTGRGRCWLEWSADEPDLDPADEQTWIQAHPAVRHRGNPSGTVPLSFLRDEWERDPEQFKRLYLNITDREGTSTSPIDLDRWQALALPAWDRSGPLVLAIDCAEEQTHGAIVSCGWTGTDTISELVQFDTGDDWIVDQIVDLQSRYPIDAVAVDPGAPAGAQISPLRNAGVYVLELDARDVTAAAAQLVAAVRTGDHRHVPDVSTDAAVVHARRRRVGDGAWAFKRTEAKPETCALIAASFARYARTSAPTPEIH